MHSTPKSEFILGSDSKSKELQNIMEAFEERFGAASETPDSEDDKLVLQDMLEAINQRKE